MEFVWFWLGFAVVVGVAAANRGRSGVAWFLLAAIISPLLGGLLLLAMGKPAGDSPELVDESGQAVTPATHVRCPSCRELVRKDARKCKHCSERLIPQ